MVLKYWDNKFYMERQLKYLLNNKLAKYPKSNKNKNKPKNMSNVKSKCITSRKDKG